MDNIQADACIRLDFLLLPVTETSTPVPSHHRGLCHTASALTVKANGPEPCSRAQGHTSAAGAC